MGSWSTAKRVVRFPGVTSLPAVRQRSSGERDPSCRWHLLPVLGLRAQRSAPAWPRHRPGAGRGQRDAVYGAPRNMIELKVPLLIAGRLGLMAFKFPSGPN